MKSLATILSLVLFSNFSYSQDSNHVIVSPLYVAYNISGTTMGDVLPTYGGHVSLGLNPGVLIKKGIVLGVFFDLRWLKNLGSSNEYGKITNAINTHIIKNHDNELDSARSAFLQTAFSHTKNDKKYFLGSYLGNWGIMFSPYPDRYGGLMLQVKRGSREFPIYGVYGDSILGDDSNGNSIEWLNFKIPNNIEIQLTSKPLTFFKQRKEIPKYPSWRDNFFVSFFYRQPSLKRAEFDNQPLSKFLKPAFFEQYGTSHQFGFKVSFGIY
ncbi:MAG: hypothetical protein COA58_16055 [Bacteroidetes bacterium]|nr:MAG: hypothetical protein COA58_16055 [Bacteroidota bacterium]